MKDIKRGEMPDGTHIQIEDWSEDYSFHNYGDTLVAYPRTRYGDRIRAEITCESYEQSISKFDQLKNIDDLVRLGFTTMKASRMIPLMEAM